MSGHAVFAYHVHVTSSIISHAVVSVFAALENFNNCQLKKCTKKVRTNRSGSRPQVTAVTYCCLFVTEGSNKK